MPSYRGITQANLLRSINDAIELLETHSTGPECQKLVDALRAPDALTHQSPLAGIAGAVDDVSLAQAVRGAGLFWLFARTRDVLSFHALNDTDGKGRDVFERLSPWGAMDAATMAAYTALDEETDSWLAAQYARTVPATEENLGKIAMVTQALSQDKKAVLTAFDTITNMMAAAKKGADDATLRDSFLKLDLHERYVALKSIAAIPLMDGAESDMTITPSIRRYVLAIDDLTQKKINSRDPSVKAIRTKVEEALSPFYELDEVTSTGIGKANMDLPDLGVIFNASARAAQAVATALPDMKVVDETGKVIPPRTRPQPKDPGFKL